MPSNEYMASGPASEAVTIIRPDVSMVGKVPIIYAHGFSLANPIPLYIQNRNQFDFLEAMARFTGSPVLVPYLGGLATWGNDTQHTRFGTAITWAGTNLGTRTDKAFVCGESMGTLITNWIWRNPSLFCGAYLLDPIMALEAFRVRNSATFTSSIYAAYTNQAGYEAALPTHDPSAAANKAVLASFHDRIRLDYMESDEYIPPAEVEAYAASIGCWSQSYPGNHAAGFDINHEDAVAWVRRTIRMYS